MGQLISQSLVRLCASILLIFTTGISGPLAAQEMAIGDPHVYGPVNKADTLKSIAISTIGKRDFKLRDTMADIYYANPDAFVAGRSQILRSGVLLKLPEYLAWNIESSNPTASEEKPKPAERPEAPKQAVAKIPAESTSSSKEIILTATQTKEAATTERTSPSPVRLDPALSSKPGSREDTEIQLQLLKRQLSDMNTRLVENQEKSEMNARLQGAYYLITAVIILILLTLLMFRFRADRKTLSPAAVKPRATPQSRTAQKVKVALKPAATENNPAIEPSSPVVKPPIVATDEEAADDDLTPASPATSIDDPTPIAPSLAYDDTTPANPSLAYQDKLSADTDGEEDSSASDIHEVIHDISGCFKGMSDDKDASNLALARVYMDLGDYQQAKSLLTAAHKSVTSEYVKQAEDMIHELLQAQMFASSFNEIVGDLSDDDSTVTRQLEELSMDKNPMADVSDSFLAHEEDDESSRELEMAQIYFELGDHSRCKQHLAIILGSDNSSFKTEAYALLKEIESKEADDDMTTKSDSLPDGIGDQAVIKEITPPEKTYNKEQLNELSSQFMMISNNKNGTKLALAHVHLDMGEYERALKLLKEVVASGDEECTPDAEALIKKIGSIN